MKPTTKLLLKGAYVLGATGLLAAVVRARVRMMFEGPSTTTTGTTGAGTTATSSAGGLPIVQLLTTHKFNEGRRSAICQIVIHTAGFSEVPNGARLLAEQLADVDKWTRDASWHYAVDNAQIVQSIKDEDTAWHANEVNDWSIGIELVAKEQYASEWQDEYSKAELDLAERLVAYLCHKHDIPVHQVTTDELIADPQTPGITGHGNVAQAAGRTDRSDPGSNFPWSDFISKVGTYYATQA